MVNLSTIGQVASAAPQGYEQYQDRRLAEAVRRLALQAQREKLEDMAMDRGAMGAAFAGFMHPDTNGAPALPGSMPMPGPVPMGPGEASVPRAQAQPPAPSPAPQENPTTGLQPGAPTSEPSSRGAAGGGAPNVPNGTQVNFQAAQQGLQNYDLRTLAAKIKEANPGIDNQTAFRALAQMSNMLSRQQQLALRYMLQNKQPAAIEEYLFYSNLTPEQQGVYDRARRSQPWINLGDRFEQPGGAPGSAPGQPPARTVGVPPAQGPDNARSVAAAQVEGEAGANAALALPKVEQNANYMTSLIDQMLKHPGMKGVIGVPDTLSGGAYKIAGQPIAGTPEAAFVALLDQLRGNQFLEAFESLRGAGAITQTEGDKATDARSRMMKTNQSEEDYRKAAKEFLGVIQRGVEKARRAAQTGPRTGTPAPAPTSSPPISLLKDGVQTTFSNGQVWTLEGGAAKRIR